MSLSTETLVRLSKARAFFPGENKPALVSLKRYGTRGYRGVRLETVLLRNMRHTSREAVARFIAAISDPARIGQSAPAESSEVPK